MTNKKIFTKQTKAFGRLTIVVISAWLAGCSSSYTGMLSPSLERLQVKIPETEISVSLDRLVRIDGDLYLENDYAIVHAPDVVERGTVWLNSSSIIAISPVDITSIDKMLFAAPFTVSNQGSGVFDYVGLFAQNPETEISTHLDSYFLGDRIRRIRLRDAGRAVKVSFLKHAADQAMAQTPTEPAAVNLYVQDDLTWRPYPGMHPSWDKNNDGINDCEDDGTCDDSMDYTIARDDRSL